MQRSRRKTRAAGSHFTNGATTGRRRGRWSPCT
jgi:hypothetical protein